MARPIVLDKSAVQKWLQAQRAAAEHMRAKRVRFLLQLRSEQSCALYLALWQSGTVVQEEPSPLLTSMRQCLKRWHEKRTRRNRS